MKTQTESEPEKLKFICKKLRCIDNEYNTWKEKLKHSCGGKQSITERLYSIRCGNLNFSFRFTGDESKLNSNFNSNIIMPYVAELKIEYDRPYNIYVHQEIYYYRELGYITTDPNWFHPKSFDNLKKLQRTSKSLLLKLLFHIIPIDSTINRHYETLDPFQDKNAVEAKKELEQMLGD